MPIETDLAIKKIDNKYGMVLPYNTASIKTVPELLAEVVAFYIWLFIIKI